MDWITSFCNRNAIKSGYIQGDVLLTKISTVLIQYEFAPICRIIIENPHSISRLQVKVYRERQ